MSRDDATLLDILKAARLAVAFIENMDKSNFLADLKTQSAVLHQLLVLGEAVKRFSNTFRENHSEIPWKRIAGMRDKVIHGYNDVDLDEVWRTLEADIPQLITQLEELAPKKPES